jgi:hypothetical protein
MIGRIRCNTCRAEGMGDGDSILFCMGCYGKLEAALAKYEKALRNIAVANKCNHPNCSCYLFIEIAREATIEEVAAQKEGKG